MINDPLLLYGRSTRAEIDLLVKFAPDPRVGKPNFAELIEAYREGSKGQCEIYYKSILEFTVGLGID